MNRIKKINTLITLIFFFMLLLCTKVYAADISYIRGSNRYETAVKLSQSKYDKSDYVVLVSGENFSDALCSSLIAKKYNAPILLTGKSTLNTYSKNEIIRLNASKVVIVGGYGAVNNNVEKEINNMGVFTIRCSGNDRYDTCYETLSGVNVGDEAFIVSGRDFSDALSAASVAYIKNAPIILADERGISNQLKDYIINRNFKNIYIIGGPKVISSSVDSIPNSVRIYGNDRYDTNFKVYEKFKDSFKADGVYVASGENYPDALASIPICGSNSLPEVLMDKSASVEQDSLLRFNNTLKNIILIGNANWQPTLEPVITYKEQINSPSELFNALYYFMDEDTNYISLFMQNESLKDEKYLEKVARYITDYLKCTYYINIDIKQLYYDGECVFYKNHTNPLCEYNTPAGQELERAKSLTDKCNEIISNIIKPNMSDLEKERAIHDYIINNAEYDYSNYLKGTVPYDSHVDYGILINHTAVCDGYANTFKHLCTLAGINAIVVEGKAHGEGHAWNIVQVNNKYYQVDVTWDDPICLDGGNMLRYNYFNVSDDFMSSDHEWVRNLYPVCN